MSIFGKKYKLQPDWQFSQKGNLWKFIFAGKNKIVGETRDIENKKLYFFCLDIATGKTYLNDFLFEEGNYWIATEGANDNMLFVSRFQSPELPYPKNIIALDITTGTKLWENEEYVYHFCSDDKIYGIRTNSGKITFADINPSDGSATVLSEDSASKLNGMKAKSDSDLFTEYYDYPKPHSAYPADSNSESIFAKETEKGRVEGDIEYINRKNFLIFNYYSESGNTAGSGRKLYRNIFCIYNPENAEKLFEDILNENSNYNVPDNFFMKDERLYYLKGREQLISINLGK